MTKLRIVLSLVICMLTSMNVYAEGMEGYSSGVFDYVLLEDGTAEITGYHGGSSEGYEVSVPRYVDGYEVTSIGEGAFDEHVRITAITLPDSVTTIGAYAFSGCFSLASITLNDNLTNIGERAFAWCPSLTSIALPEAMTSIGNSAFYYV